MTNLEQQIEAIMLRLDKVEAGLFGKAEQPPTKKRTFGAFYVDCTRDEYPEVKRILEAQGYKLWGNDDRNRGEDCVSTNENGEYLTYWKNERAYDKPIYTLPQLREKFGVEQPQEKLRDFVVPLAHATLTRDEVASRCIAAAEKKGYKADPNPRWSTLVDSGDSGINADHFFANPSSDGYAFHNHDCAPHPLTTLEAFEEYCGVEQPQQCVGIADETAEPQLHGIVNTLDTPAKAKTRLEWLNELPDGYRERAVSNCKKWGRYSPQDVCPSMQEAIWGMCGWKETPEDWEFWRDVYEHYAHHHTLPPLPSGNSEKPNAHEPTAQPVYEAGFGIMDGDFCGLRLPDSTELWYSQEHSAWRKDMPYSQMKPHTLTPVATYTVGRFYALAGIEPNHLNDWRSYALCVKNEDVPHFVRPTSEYGIVSVERKSRNYVSTLEVTPL